jgi:hypothetical protein
LKTFKKCLQLWKNFHNNPIEFLSPNATYYGEVTDANVRVYINYYRDRYQYNLAYFRSLCKSQLIECPIVEKNYYTISTDLFISKTDPIGETHSFPDTVNYLNIIKGFLYFNCI